MERMLHRVLGPQIDLVVIPWARASKGRWPNIDRLREGVEGRRLGDGGRQAEGQPRRRRRFSSIPGQGPT